MAGKKQERDSSSPNVNFSTVFPYFYINAMRANLDLTVIKPSGALHASYIDSEITELLKKKIFAALDWFLGSGA